MAFLADRTITDIFFACLIYTESPVAYFLSRKYNRTIIVLDFFILCRKKGENEENMKKMKTKKETKEYGQAARLNQIVKRAGFVVITCVVLLVAFIGSNFILSAIEEEQLENTMLLNQYRLGSKKLTSEVRAYAVTGKQEHYDAYMKELNEDKNRDTAWNGLKKNRLTD